MESVFAKTEELVDDVKEYIDVRIETAKLAVAEKTSMVIANAAAGLAVLIAFIFFWMLLVTGLSILIGIWVGSTWAGFMIMAIVCLITAAIIWSVRKRLIQMPVMNSLINILFSKHIDDEED